MLEQQSTGMKWIPGRVFYVGLAVVLLANAIPFIPAWTTYIHMWRVEIAASLLLSAILAYILVKRKSVELLFEVHPEEWKFVILPLLAFIVWSSLSVLWAPSWKSAIHHSLIWAEYLIFYLIFRHLLSERENTRRLTLVFAATLAFYAIPAIVEYSAFLSFGGVTTLGMRFAKYGEQVVTILPLLLIAIVRMRGRRFVIGASAVVLLWLLIFCTFGRINYLLFAVIITCVLAVLVVSKRYRPYVPKFALLTLILVLAPLPFNLLSALSPEVDIPVLARMSDSRGMSGSNNFRKMMYSVSAEMIRANPAIGVGADNFGMQVNQYREAYGRANPGDVNLATAEDQIPQHAHNEFLQIIAELGIVGGVIFAWFLAGVALLALRSIRTIRSGSLTGFAAVLGLLMFLASSLVSAYSFRVMQNGIVFFFVLAVASGKLFAKSGRRSDQQSYLIPHQWLAPAAAAGLLFCVGLVAYSALRVSSVIVASRANQTRTLSASMPLYDLAMRLDDENPDVRQNLGMRLFRAKRYEDAVPYLQSAVTMGRAPSAELSYLATAQSLAGDDKGAEETMAISAALYPRSTFVLARYANLLEQNGKTAESNTVFSRALDIDERAAKTWHALIVSGPKAVSEMSVRDMGYSPVMDLQPKSSIYAVVTERFIRFPEEQRYSFGKLSEEEN